jgi:hypothetical protein
MKQPVDLTPLQKDYAVYLPAISSFYSTYVDKQRKEEFVSKERIPVGFDRGIEGMNFLNPEQGYFYYKYGLYSAGHAQLDIEKSLNQELMIQQRDRSKTMILGDSGGYQIGKGVIKFDWSDFEGEKANKVREKILTWLDVTADWAMMLDVPTWACDHIHQPKTGLKDFQDCLDKTRFNNEYFIKKRLGVKDGGTKLLNVLQGSNWENAEAWYQGVKEFSDTSKYGDKAAEGWAMGGANMCKMPVTLKRLITMKFDGMLEGKDWMHFLGTAQLDWSCYLTSIQRQIRKHVNENFTISFDCASPFIATAHGLVYTNAQHTPKRWSVIMDKAPDTKTLSESDFPFPFESEVGRRLTMGDICYYDSGVLKSEDELGLDPKTGKPITLDTTNPNHYHIVPNRLNKLGKIPRKTSWDSFAYALMMSHNVYCHIAAVQRANQLMDIELYNKPRMPWRTYKAKMKDNDFSDEISDWVPRNILYFDSFVEELFACKDKDTAFEMIETATTLGFLNGVEGARLRGGVTSIADNLFYEEGEENKSAYQDERNDGELDKLESLFRED